MKVNKNITKEADAFNVVRKVTVINCISNDVLFQMTGRMSIKADIVDKQLEVIVEHKEGKYRKHVIGLPHEGVTYVIEDLGGAKVSKYNYELNFNPKMWLPPKVKILD